MFNKLFRNLGKNGKEAQEEHQSDSIIDDMGGSMDRLSPKERRRLAKLTQQSSKIRSMSGRDQVSAFLNNMDNEMDQIKLMRKTGAFERGEQNHRDKIAAIRDEFRTRAELPPPLRKMLDDVPVSPLRDAITENLRETLFFSPIMPPRAQTGLSFFGGLPMAPKGLAWPRYTDTKGQQRPAHFIGQIDCAEIPDFGLRHLYPEDGILFFFFPLDREGYKTITGDLVIHLQKTDDITESVPSAALVPYKHAEESYRKFWLHELAHPHLSRGSILPKWEMEMDVGFQLDADAIFSEEKFKLTPAEAETLEKACGCDAMQFTSDFVDLMQNDPEISCRKGTQSHFEARLKADDGFMIGFEGFPHNFHAMHTLLGGYCTLLDEAENTLMHYVQNIGGDDAQFFAKEGWIELEHHETRKKQCLENIEAMAKRRQEITDVMEELGPDVLAAPTTEKDRMAFWDLWRNLSSDGELKLESHLSDQWMPFLNHPNAMNRFVQGAAVHTILASACNGLDGFMTLPKDIARDWVETNQNRHAFQRFRHQSLGYAPRTQGSEGEDGHSIALMQFPDVDFRDFTIADLGALQYWVDLPDLKRGDFSAIRATIGN